MNKSDIRSMLNDKMRKSLPAIFHPNALILTKGISLLGQEKITEILNIVRDYQDFNMDNDPWGEHDFGAFDYDGKRMFWKIDYYNGQEGYKDVLTIMLAEEY